MRKEFIIIVFGFLSYISASENPGFVISFQTSGNISTEEWAEYKEQLAKFESFTACHWEYLLYFNWYMSYVWAYCIATHSNHTAPISCIQFYHEGNEEVANRGLTLNADINGKVFNAEVKSFRHRTWNHFCWSYSKEEGYNKLYYNGQLLKTSKIYENEEITFSGYHNESVFIIGQEPDKIKGGFQISQVYEGNITELNIWRKIMNDDEIQEMAKCKIFPKGDIVAWKREKFKINKAIVSNFLNKQDLCGRKKKMVIFPERQTLQQAKNLCAAHVGKIVTPHNEEENIEVTNLAKRYNNKCSHFTGGLIWLGMKLKEKEWIEMDDNDEIGKVTAKKLSNFANQNFVNHTNCAFLMKDGSWDYVMGDNDYCPMLELCTICSFNTTPVFTLSGLCPRSNIDWNYYLNTNEQGEVFYDGYKGGKIMLKNKSWKTAHAKEVNGDESAETIGGVKWPVGRINWNISDPNCGVMGMRHLALSKCQFGEEFTCNTGRCIGLKGRCDGKRNCMDGSDEVDCKTVQIPTSYRKVDPPESKVSEKGPIPIYIKVRIINVDSIDTIKMQIGLSLEIQLTWRDERISFKNLGEPEINEGIEKEISVESMDQLWLPMQDIIHDTAVIGKIEEDTNKFLKVKLQSKPEPLYLFNTGIEELLYQGAKNDLIMVQRFKMIHRCKFYLRYFPFDHQKCDFPMTLKITENNTVELVRADDSISYNGSKTLEQFQIHSLSSSTHMERKKSIYTFSIKFDRLYGTYITSIYLKTILLWLLAYGTLYIEPVNFNNRFMGSITALLVQVSLLSSIHNDLPLTSYFKYIDLWVIWYIGNIFIIILFHILMDLIIKKKKKGNAIQPLNQSLIKLNDSDLLDTFGKVFMFLITLFFNVIYFILTVCQSTNCGPIYY